jgi:hypothetical protein
MPAIDLLRACAALEECYEFTLAFAAQGHGAEPGAPADAQIRERLARAAAVAAELARAEAAQCGAFAAVLARDAAAAGAVIELVLAQPAIGSQMVDSLNASLHLRALLADIFLLAETLEARQPAPAER